MGRNDPGSAVLVMRGWTVGLVLASLVACGPAALATTVVDSRFVLTDSVATLAPAADRAILRLVREQYVRQRALPPEMIYLDGAPASLLPQQTWFEVSVSPGPHRVCGLAEQGGFPVLCDAGHVYLLRLREVVDHEDQLTATWLFDDPARSEELVRGRHLRRVSTTDAGLRYLEKKKRVICPESGPPDASAALRDSFDHILIERPLDQRNLENDFSQLYGSIRLDSAGIHYRLRMQVRAALNRWRLVTDSLDVPADSIVRVSFGGLRFTGINPWVDVYHRTSAGVRIVSFADTREAQGTSTYNDLFAAIEALRSRRRNAGVAEGGEAAR